MSHSGQPAYLTMWLIIMLNIQNGDIRLEIFRIISVLSKAIFRFLASALKVAQFFPCPFFWRNSILNSPPYILSYIFVSTSLMNLLQG